eukprot:728755-Alexandrium_andersonii.AAC.1
MARTSWFHERSSARRETSGGSRPASKSPQSRIFRKGTLSRSRSPSTFLKSPMILRHRFGKNL